RPTVAANPPPEVAGPPCFTRGPRRVDHGRVTSPSWDPRQYERFAAERARPFHDLVAQIRTPDPRTVVDLGCGPGTMTATLADRWPDARVLGLDSSADMIATAGALARPGRLAFRQGDSAPLTLAPD